jgi:hypothetical protein
MVWLRQTITQKERLTDLHATVRNLLLLGTDLQHAESS